MRKFTLLFLSIVPVLISQTSSAQTAVTDPIDALLASKVKHPPNSKDLDLPENLVPGTPAARKDLAVDGMGTEIKQLLAGKEPGDQDDPSMINLKSLGYSSELKTEGTCSGLGISGPPCHLIIVGRRQFRIPNASLQTVMDTFTSDIRTTRDKTFTIGVMTIKRHHWEIQGKTAFKVDPTKDSEPMKPGQVYRIKKCRDTTMNPWRCNTISYQLYPIPSGFLLIGMLTKTKKEPASFKVAGCAVNGGACGGRFLEKQMKNDSSGTLSLSLFLERNDPQTGKTIIVHEIAESYVDNSANSRKLLLWQEKVTMGMAAEYQILAEKMRKLTPVSSVTDQAKSSHPGGHS